MAKVYLVSSGDYPEDYGINHVSSTRQEAEEWIGPGAGNYRIDEWEVDDREDNGWRLRTVYSVTLILESGEEVVEPWMGRSRVVEKPISFRSSAEISDHHKKMDDGIKIVWAESVVSREHAREVAVEKRQEWLRTRDLAKAAPDVADLELIATIDAEGVVTPTRPGWESVYRESGSGNVTLKIIPPDVAPDA